MIKVSTTGMAVSLKTDLRFPISGQWGHGDRIIHAVKAADKKDPSSVRQSAAYQALQKIAEFYNADTGLKGLSSKERLQKRQELIKPMVEEFFAWVKQQVSDCTVPPKSKTGQGLNFVINQEKYRKRTIASTP